MDDPIVISALFTIAVGLLLYALFAPRNDKVFAPDNSKEAEDSVALKLTTVIGGELYSLLPAGSKNDKVKTYPRIESLLKRSGNPWNLKAEEFVFFQYSSAFVGFIIGWIAWIPINLLSGWHWAVVVGLATILGFMFPKIRYNEIAKKRDLEFKRHLPEALDLIIISLSAGVTFSQAITESVPNMPDGVLRDEFIEMERLMDTGTTMHNALENFAKRSPNESISTFIKAIQEAQELNIPMIDALESRAKASRQEFFAMIEGKTAMLESKMIGILTPTLIPALIIIALAPAIPQLMNSF